MNYFIEQLTDPWVLFGFFAQFLFFLRFVVQWIASEKEKKSIIPISFWYLGIAGSLMILIYSINRKDIVFIIGSILSTLIYLRNIILVKRINID
ncbi:MAG: lipid-A-disaccharide synthase N-terminal domain-containing protein [Candidatus Levybacteria bacterium]|nr:lipid-A-disaccharide synthase N-terminal domain-containing protein [Candidatus Levybacteria bacterium]